jgi:hypothetical protein
MSSFKINSCVATNKNLVCAGHYNSALKSLEECNESTSSQSNMHRLICYTPMNAEHTKSLLLSYNSKTKKILTDPDLALIPVNAIINKISFFGVNGFTTKGTFSLGLGQLNNTISLPLIENTDSSIANEKVGGCRDFISYQTTGLNNKILILVPLCVNITLENPITIGGLQVVIDYEMKPKL